MSKGYKSFSEYVEFREGATVPGANAGIPAATTSGPTPKDQKVAKEIFSKPNMLMKPGTNPQQQQKMIQQAQQNMKANKVSIDAAWKAASMQQDQ